jgi:hypothetical protein
MIMRQNEFLDLLAAKRLRARGIRDGGRSLQRAQQIAGQLAKGHWVIGRIGSRPDAPKHKA